MIFKQWEQVMRLKEPPKGQTRRPSFPYELAVQLWKRRWSYPQNNRRTSGGRVYRPYTRWDEWQKRHPINDQQIAEANRILAQNLITLPVQPGRGKKSKGRIRITKIRRERLGDISADDIFAEGIGIYNPSDGKWYPITVLDVAREEYAQLWESIYGKGAWGRMRGNDVWVLEWPPTEAPNG